MKNLFLFFILSILIVSCGPSNKTINSTINKEEAVVIKNDSLEYEIIIYDVGFNVYLNSIARPADFYSQNFYEVKNNLYVIEWNRRALNPIQFGDFYTNLIDYDPHIDYGLNVNYKLYNYFKFLEYKYRIRFR